jgi:hypothetical protein
MRLGSSRAELREETPREIDIVGRLPVPLNLVEDRSQLARRFCYRIRRRVAVDLFGQRERQPSPDEVGTAVLTGTIASRLVRTDSDPQRDAILEALRRIEKDLADLKARLR